MTSVKKNYTLCDFQCPIKDKCARYLEGLDRSKTDHFAFMPYKNGKCNFHEPLTEDDIIDRVNQIVNRRMN